MGTLRKKSIKNDLAKEQHDNRAMSRAMPAGSSKQSAWGSSAWQSRAFQKQGNLLASLLCPLPLTRLFQLKSKSGK